MGEPAMLNPNSYANVLTVLKHIQEQTISGTRNWTIIGADGVLYLLGQSLRDGQPELKNLLLLPGFGHFELNFVKALFRLLWPVGLKTLAKLVGFRTERALQYCPKATDHHKAWDMLGIYFQSVAPFLLMQYMSAGNNQNVSDHSIQHCNLWLQALNNPMYRFQSVMVFR